MTISVDVWITMQYIIIAPSTKHFISRICWGVYGMHLPVWKCSWTDKLGRWKRTYNESARPEGQLSVPEQQLTPAGQLRSTASFSDQVSSPPVWSLGLEETEELCPTRCPVKGNTCYRFALFIINLNECFHGLRDRPPWKRWTTSQVSWSIDWTDKWIKRNKCSSRCLHMTFCHHTQAGCSKSS